MIAPTSRAILLAMLGAPISLLAGALVPWAWPLGIAWAIGVATLVLVDARLSRSAGDFRFGVETPRLAGIGAGAVEGRAFLDFGSGPAPEFAEVSIESNHLVEAVPMTRGLLLANGYGEMPLELNTHRRGEGSLERAFVRWLGPLGLARNQRVETLAHKIAITPDFAAVQRHATRLFSRTFIHGLKPMADRGDGSEFDSLVKFQAGMDRRLIDWKQTARHLNLLAKEVRAERNHQIAFAIDTGRLMCQPIAGAPRVDRSLNAALMLAYVGLKLGDRVSFFSYDSKPRLATGFASGPAAFAHLKVLTAGIDYSTEETNHTLGLATLAERLQRRSMVVVFTDFEDTITAELMVENLTRLNRRHMMVFIAFRDEELETLSRASPETAKDVSRAVIAHQLLRDRMLVLARLRRLGIYIVDAPADRLGPELVRAYDELRRRERI
jgi:uncharacterized protein (DUF58 family)